MQLRRCIIVCFNNLWTVYLTVSVDLPRPKFDPAKATDTTRAVILKPADSTSYIDESDRWE